MLRPPVLSDNSPIPVELAAALAGLVLTVVTGVYLVSMQNALQAGREVVKEMTVHRKQLEQELAELAELRRYRSELTGGLAEMQECILGDLIEISERLQMKEISGSTEEDDYKKIVARAQDRSKELSLIRKVDKLVQSVYARNLLVAQGEAEQWILLLTSVTIRSELIIVAVRPIRESLRQLQRQSPELFTNQSNYPNLAKLLDHLIMLEPNRP